MSKSEDLNEFRNRYNKSETKEEWKNQLIEFTFGDDDNVYIDVHGFPNGKCRIGQSYVEDKSFLIHDKIYLSITRYFGVNSLTSLMYVLQKLSPDNFIKGDTLYYKIGLVKTGSGFMPLTILYPDCLDRDKIFVNEKTERVFAQEKQIKNNELDDADLKAQRFGTRQPIVENDQSKTVKTIVESLCKDRDELHDEYCTLLVRSENLTKTIDFLNQLG